VPVGEKLPPRQATEHSHGEHDNVEPQYLMKFVVLAIDRHDGSVLWERVARTERPHESTHESASWASASPVTDGEYVTVSFGSSGLYCFDMKGTPQWQVDLGVMHTKHGHGEGSSPALFGDTVVVNWDQQGDSFVVALDRRTGSERWRTVRDEITSWSSPLIVEVDGKPQAVISATNRVRGYDLATGDVVWACGGLSGNVVATPVAANGIAYVANSYDTREMMAIRMTGAKRDITGTGAVLWTRHQHTPYVPSPVLYDGALCFLRHYQGVMTCVQAETGTEIFGPARLDGIDNVYASLVAAAGRIYVVDRDGTTVVINKDRGFELLARNQLEDSFSASPAIVGNELILRGSHNLYCIAATPD